jgi:hypothetical protein
MIAVVMIAVIWNLHVVMVPCLSGTNRNLNGMEGKNAAFSSISFLYGTLVNGVEWRLNGEKFAVQPNRSPFSLPLKMNGVEWRPSPFANQTGRYSISPGNGVWAADFSGGAPLF